MRQWDSWRDCILPEEGLGPGGVPWSQGSGHHNTWTLNLHANLEAPPPHPTCLHSLNRSDLTVREPDLCPLLPFDECYVEGHNSAWAVLKPGSPLGGWDRRGVLESVWGLLTAIFGASGQG
jgi:hypothetical protein